MLSVLTIPVICEACGQSGAARWLEDTSGPRARRALAALTEGFCSVDRGGQLEPDILCMRCNDTHRAGDEARSALPALR